MGVGATSFGDALRDARLAHGLSVAEAAGSELSASGLSRVESGEVPAVRLPIAVLQRLGLNSELHPASEDVALACDIEAALRTGNWGALPSLLSRFTDGNQARGLYVGLLCERNGDLPAAQRLLTSWLETEPLYSLNWTRGRTALCRCNRDSGRIAEAIAIGEDTLAALRSQLDVDAEAITELKSTLTGAYCESGDLERALALTEAPGTNDPLPPWAEVTRCWARAIALHVAGRADEARDTAFAGLRILRTLNRPLTLARLQNVTVWLAMQAVHFDADQLEEMLRDSEEAVRADDTNRSLATLLTTKAELSVKAGDLRGIRELLAEAQGLVMTEDAGDRARVLAACAQVYASMGEIEEAVRLLLLARQLLEDSGARRSAAATWRQMADIYTKLQQPDLAVACMQAAMDLLEL